MTVADVRAVGVAFDVGKGMVLAMIGHPRDDRSLDRCRAENGQDAPHGGRGLERTMGEKAVEPDRDSDCGQQVHDRGDCQVSGADQAVPEQDNGYEGCEEGNDDGAKVDCLLCSCHFSHREGRYVGIDAMYW